MHEHLVNYVLGKRKPTAAERRRAETEAEAIEKKILDDPRTPNPHKKESVLHELYLTAVMHSLVRAAQSMNIPVGVAGGMGLSHLYSMGNTQRRRNARDLDLEIPQDVPIESIRQLFEAVKLSPPKLLENRYGFTAMRSTNTYEGTQLHVYISQFCPNTRLFNQFSCNQYYTNHVIGAFGLEPIYFRQLTPSWQIVSKALALADPNRAVAIGKMDDIHDLMHALRQPRGVYTQEHLNAALRSKFWMDERVDLQRFRKNLSTVLRTMDSPEAFAQYKKWLYGNPESLDESKRVGNLFNLYTHVRQSEWHQALRSIAATFSAPIDLNHGNRELYHDPYVAIRTKIQLAREHSVLGLASNYADVAPPELKPDLKRAFNPGKKEVRSGLFARVFEPFVRTEYGDNLEGLDQLSKLPPDELADALRRLVIDRKREMERQKKPT